MGSTLSGPAEKAVAKTLLRSAPERLAAEIAQACRAHERYLADYGSLGDAVRACAE